MVGGYGTIATILIYFLLLRKLDSPSMNARKAAVVLIVASFVLLAAITMLENVARGLSLLTGILSIEYAVTILVQFIVAVGIFRKVEESGDDYLSFALWGGVGLAVIFYIVPVLLQRFSVLL